jgi:hypothetical protein
MGMILLCHVQSNGLLLTIVVVAIGKFLLQGRRNIEIDLESSSSWLSF